MRRRVSQSRRTRDGSSQKTELTWQRHLAPLYRCIYTDNLVDINTTTIKSLYVARW